MPDYEKMYFRLAATVADVIDILIAAQLKAEADYIAEESLPIPLGRITAKAGEDEKTRQG